MWLRLVRANSSLSRSSHYSHSGKSGELWREKIPSYGLCKQFKIGELTLYSRHYSLRDEATFLGSASVCSISMHSASLRTNAPEGDGVGRIRKFCVRMLIILTALGHAQRAVVIEAVREQRGRRDLASLKRRAQRQLRDT